jgi:hypothetical protein
MVTNARIAELIRERRTDLIEDAIADGEYFEMQTFAMALLDLVLSGLVDRETAANAATNRHDFEIALDHAEKAALVAIEEAGPVVPAQSAPPDDAPPTLRVAASS